MYILTQVIGTHQLIARDEYMKGSILIIADLFLTPELPQSGSIFHITPVGQRFKTRYKPGDLLLPVVKG